MPKIKIKTCPFGCRPELLEIYDRGNVIKCRECGITIEHGLEFWNSRKRAKYVEREY